MRVFIGIKANEELQEKIIKWQEKHRNLPVRFIKQENLHLTLVPPWYERKINHLVKSLKSFKSQSSGFKIYFNKILYAPHPQPRLIWTEGDTPQALIKLRNALVKYLGKKKEKRQFRSHLTIARFKPEIFNSIKEYAIERQIDWSMNSCEITLFESKLSPSGANYEIIQRFKI